ncbi:MAG: diaminopimelate epimerase [Cyclobacteriaceae bacterium]
MKVHFYKYQAAGNDFVLIDNRDGRLNISIEQVKQICNRRFGVGGDGLILLEKDPSADFNMVYFNSDGSQSLCGNGCRTAIDLASKLQMINGSTRFSAYDGPHHGSILEDGLIRLQMNDVTEVKRLGDDFFIHTGSPHVIRFVSDLKNYPVVEEGRTVRYSERFQPAGTNVNFVELLEGNTLAIRTYERGVEDETMSCGTGITAAALAAHFRGFHSPVRVKARGGELKVEFRATISNSGQADRFHGIFLIGPAKMVYQGELEL